MEAAIRVGGLADIKAARIRAILDTLVQERGACCLEHLRALPDGEVKLQLTRQAPPVHALLPGVRLPCLKVMWCC